MVAVSYHPLEYPFLLLLVAHWKIPSCKGLRYKMMAVNDSSSLEEYLNARVKYQSSRIIGKKSF